MRRSQRIFLFVAALLIAWAPFHFVLQHRYELNTWKLWGLAMYTEPSPQRGIPYLILDDQPRDVATLLSTGCLSQRDWNEHEVLGGLMHMQRYLACASEVSASIGLDSYTYNVRTGAFRPVRQHWELRPDGSRQWRSFQDAERRWTLRQ